LYTIAGKNHKVIPAIYHYDGLPPSIILFILEAKSQTEGD